MSEREELEAYRRRAYLEAKERGEDTASAAVLTGTSGAAEKPSYLMEAARRGLTTLPSLAAGIWEGMGSQPSLEEMVGAYTETQDYLTKQIGGTGARPEALSERIIAGGIESLADPLSYFLPGSRLIKQARPLVKTALKATEAFATGAGAEGGGIAGEIAGGKFGETGAMVGRTVGALTGGVAGGVGSGFIPRSEAAYRWAKPHFSERFAKINAEEAIKQSEKAASKHIENVFIAAAASDPNFLKVFDEAIAAQKATGIKLPISGVLADNKVINAYIADLSAKDPAFGKRYFAEFQNAQQELRKKSVGMFGDPRGANDALGANIKDVDILGAVQRRQRSIDLDIARKSKGLAEVDPAAFGSKVVDVTERAEKAARASTVPEYVKAFDIGRAKGVELPDEAVGDIFDFVVGEKANDIFKTFPSIHGKVKSAFAPKVSEGAGLVDQFGKPMGEQSSRMFKAASLEDMDSLKREVNLQLRKTKTDSEVRTLLSLKEKLNTHIDSLDGDFVAAYRGADQMYLQKVGLPFNEEAIKTINRAKFDENVIPLLTKNKSALSQFLDATGGPGKELAEQAFVSDLAKSAVRDGVLNPNRAKAWLAANKDALSLVPDVKERVLKMSTDVQSLVVAKNALDGKFIKQAQESILKLEGKSAQELVGSMYGSQNFTNKFMAQHGGNRDSLRAVRSFLLDDIIRAAKPLDVLNDRTKAATFDRVFGPTYSKQVSQLAIIADRITKDPSSVAPRLPEINKKLIEAALGTSPERVYSLLVTNPVASKQVAFMTILSRFFNKTTSALADKQMKEILLDEDKAILLFKSLQPTVDKLDMNAMASSLAKLTKKTGWTFLDIVKQDAKAGALRSYRGMNKETETMTEEQP